MFIPIAETRKLNSQEHVTHIVSYTNQQEPEPREMRQIVFNSKAHVLYPVSHESILKQRKDLEKWKWKVLSHIWLFATPWTIQSLEFSRPEYWSRPAYPFSSRSCQSRSQTGVSCIAGGFSTNWVIRETQKRPWGLPNPFIYLFISGAPPTTKKKKSGAPKRGAAKVRGRWLLLLGMDRPGRHAPQMRKLKHHTPPGPQKEFTAFYLENYTRTPREALWIETDGAFTWDMGWETFAGDQCSWIMNPEPSAFGLKCKWMKEAVVQCCHSGWCHSSRCQAGRFWWCDWSDEPAAPAPGKASDMQAEQGHWTKDPEPYSWLWPASGFMLMARSPRDAKKWRLSYRVKLVRIFSFKYRILTYICGI